MAYRHVIMNLPADKIKNKEVKIVYCPTDELVADYNSKPLQGMLFHRHRNVIMGIKEEDFAMYKELYIEGYTAQAKNPHPLSEANTVFKKLVDFQHFYYFYASFLTIFILVFVFSGIFKFFYRVVFLCF